MLFTIFVLLQNGVYIDTISFQNFKVKKLYIKWDEKISIVAQELNIEKEKIKKSSKTDYNKSLERLKKTLTFGSWFKQVTIEKIYINGIKGSFNYIDGESGFLDLYSQDFILKSSISSEKNLLNLEIEEFRIANKELKIDGNLILNTKNKLDMIASLNLYVGSGIKLNLYAYSDANKLSYKIVSKESIKETRRVVDLFNMDPRVKYWVYDAIKMSTLSLNTLYGWVEYENIDDAYLNLRAEAVANDLNYTYDKKLASIQTSSTDLEFKNGILYIRPHDAYTYDFFLDKSWLKIDFTKKEELLTLLLLFKGQANQDLLNLLNRYKIKLPFIQKQGELDTNLKLIINLLSGKVDALGDIRTKKARINYQGVDIDIFNADIFINNSIVKVDNMLAKYKDIATSYVDLDYNASDSKGKLTFRVNKVLLKDNNLKLLQKKSPLNAAYIISPKQDYLTVDKSKWKFKEQTISVDTMHIPFDINKLTAQIPVTSVEVPKLASALVRGDIFLKSMKANLNINLLKLNYGDLKLDQPVAPLTLTYDKKLTLSSNNFLKFDINKRKFKLDNISVDIAQKAIKIKDLLLNVGDNIKSEISAEYSFENSAGVLDLQTLELRESELGELFKNSTNMHFNIKNKNNRTLIASKEYNCDFTLTDKEWKLNLNSIDKIAKHSKILKKYNVTNGYFTLYKKSSEKNIKFFANTDYKYKFLATKNKPISSYAIDGEIDSETDNINLNVNDLVNVDIGDDVEIKAKDTGINLHEILGFFDDIKTAKETKNRTDFYLDANNCYIYLSENRHVITDSIKLKYSDNILTTKLIHKRGSAEFKLTGNNFYLYGKNFNDEFMEKLFALSKFKGGSLEFYLNGSTKEYSGMIYVKKTTILQYKILNNILAFVNTIPSLVTFSLPGYNKKGVSAKEAYINFKYKDDIYKMSDIHLISKELEIIGLGEASIKNNTINLDLNLKTDLGSTVSKIPVLGQILLGKENLSTTLTVTGALDDPDVNTQIAKSIIVAPFNIIKRTLMYPLELFKSDKDKDK